MARDTGIRLPTGGLAHRILTVKRDRGASFKHAGDQLTLDNALFNGMLSLSDCSEYFPRSV
jgi:hypothetical protein